jgi:nicotinamidase-related amidase
VAGPASRGDVGHGPLRVPWERRFEPPEKSGECGDLVAGGQRRSGSRPVIRVASLSLGVTTSTFGQSSGHVDVHPRNKMFGSLPPEAFTPDDPGAAIHPDVAPRGGEIVVHKNRVSAFAGNNLQQILAAQDIDHLVLTGVAISGIVLSTVLQAVDLDYRVTVLSEACADPNPDLHRTLINDIFPRHGEVTTVVEWTKAPGSGPGRSDLAGGR